MLRVVCVIVALVVAPSIGLAYDEAPVTDAGTIAGIVRFTGTPPKAEPIPVTKDRDVCGDEKPGDALAVGAERGVKDSVVLVRGIARGKKPAGVEVTIDASGCAFVNRVSAAGPGDHVRVKSSDSVLHHVKGARGATGVFDVALPFKHQMIDVTRHLTTPGVVRVVCDAHRHMLGWLVVHDSPYYAVTDERGAFRIDGVPPGTYTIALWHEGYRRNGKPVTITREVTVAPHGATTIDFELR